MTKVASAKNAKRLQKGIGGPAGSEPVIVSGGGKDQPMSASVEKVELDGGTVAAHPELDVPREGTRGAMLVGMLIQPNGAGVDELIAATGWLPHTTRAALTGLRKRGYDVERNRDPYGRSRYRIVVAVAASTAAPTRRARRPRGGEAQATA